MPKTKKNIKVRDLKPKKDAKGGFGVSSTQHRVDTGNKVNTGQHVVNTGNKIG